MLWGLPFTNNAGSWFGHSTSSSGSSSPVSRISVRGIPTDAHNEIIRTKDKIPNSTLNIITRIIIDDLSLKDGKSVERIKQGSSANYRRARKWARANRRTSSARTPPAA